MSEFDDLTDNYLAYRTEANSRKDEFEGWYEAQKKAPPEAPTPEGEEKFEEGWDWNKHCMQLLLEGWDPEDIEKLGTVEMPWYDPVDIVIDLLTAGTSFGIRKGAEVAEKGAEKGVKLLAKTAMKEVGYGAMAGGAMTAADIAGAGDLIAMFSGFLGPTVTAGLFTVTRKELAVFLRQLASKRPEIYEQVIDTVEKAPEGKVTQVFGEVLGRGKTKEAWEMTTGELKKASRGGRFPATSEYVVSDVLSGKRKIGHIGRRGSEILEAEWPEVVQKYEKQGLLVKADPFKVNKEGTRYTEGFLVSKDSGMLEEASKKIKMAQKLGSKNRRYHQLIGEAYGYSPEDIAKYYLEKAPPLKAEISVKGTKTQTFAGWVRKQGGINEKYLGGDIQFSQKESGVIGLTGKKKGKALMDLVVAAKEDGWLPQDATEKDFIELLSTDIFAMKNKKTRPLPLTYRGEPGKEKFGLNITEFRKKADYEKKLTEAFEKRLAEISGETGGPLVQPGKMEGAAGEFLATFDWGVVPEKGININFSKINTADDIKEGIATTAQLFEESIKTAMRGKVSNLETQRLADSQGLSLKQLLGRRIGGALNAHEAFSARLWLTSSADELVRLAKAASMPTASDLDRFAFRKQLALHYAIQAQVSGMTAEAGRALQSFNIPAGTSKVRIDYIRDLMSNFNERMPTEKIATMVASLGDARSVNKFAGKIQRAKTFDMVYEIWINSLLSGPQTHAVNTLSNSIVALWQIPERVLASGIGKVLKGPQEIAGREALSQAYGLIMGMKDGLKLAGKAFWTGEPSDILTKVEARKFRAISAENIRQLPLVKGVRPTALQEGGVTAHAADFLGNVIRIPTRALMTEDEWFKAIGYRMELHAQAFRQARLEGLKGRAMAERVQDIINDPPDNIKLSAIDAARYQTFTKPLGEGARGIQNVLRSIPALRVIVPFLRTPTNIVKFAGERTPLAILSKNIRGDIAAGGARRDLALARMATGSMIMGVVSAMAATGMITGGGPQDRRMRETKRRTGWQPYSVHIGDAYYSYSRLEPIGMLFGLAADATEIMGQLGTAEADELAAAITLSLTRNISSKTWLKGVTDAIEAFDYGGSRAERWARDLAGTAVPTGVSQLERTLDPTLQEVNSIMDKMKSRVPGWSSQLSPRLNLWGEPIILGGGLGPDIISPIYKSEEIDSPVDQELLRLELPISMPSDQISGVPLTQQEYNRFIELSGRGTKDPVTGLGLKDSLKYLMADPMYQVQSDGPEGGKALLIKQNVDKFREMSKIQLRQEFPELNTLIEATQYEKAQKLQPGGGLEE